MKNDKTCRVDSELAHLTGEIMTGAVTVALRERQGASIGLAWRSHGLGRWAHRRTLRVVGRYRAELSDVDG